MRESPAQTLRAIQQDISASYTRLDGLYRYHQSRRFAPIAAILANIERANSGLADLIGDLRALPAPTPRAGEE